MKMGERERFALREISFTATRMCWRKTRTIARPAIICSHGKNSIGKKAADSAAFFSFHIFHLGQLAAVLLLTGKADTYPPSLPDLYKTEYNSFKYFVSFTFSP